MIPFADFMHFALYDPIQGYYTKALPKIGIEGDFITAPELTPLFGQSLAAQCREILSQLHQPVILEFGAGTGRLCVDILSQLEAWGCLPESYLILEVSPYLRHRQQQFIQEAIPHLAERVVWLDRLPELPVNAVYIANEVLDAMPVHRFMLNDGQILESHVRQDAEGQWQEEFIPCTNPQLSDFIQKHLSALPSPYLSEVNLFVPGWLQACYDSLQQGVILLIDYGFPRHEYYHPDRKQGTLIGHYQHRTQSDLLAHVGDQDLTAHVDFTWVAEAAADCGFAIRGYTNQASFLINNGLLNYLSAIDDPVRQFRATQAVKQLIQPTEMGELFKVMALGKDYDQPLSGFLVQDKRASL